MTVLEGNILPVNGIISRIVKTETVVEAFSDWSANPGKYLKILVEF